MFDRELISCLSVNRVGASIKDDILKLGDSPATLSASLVCVLFRQIEVAHAPRNFKLLFEGLTHIVHALSNECQPRLDVFCDRYLVLD